MRSQQQCFAWLRAVIAARLSARLGSPGKSRAFAWALALAVLGAGVSPLKAYTVYVTNEKDNTVSIIDSSKLEVVKTIKVGQRPRGITLSKDQKWLLICTSDDNTVQVSDTRDDDVRKDPTVGTRPGAVHPASQRQSALHRQRGRQYHHRGRHRRKTGAGRDPRRRGAGGHGHQPGRQAAGQHLRDHQHGPLHRHRHARDRSTTSWSTAGRASPSSRPTARSCGSAPRSAARSA